MSRLAIQGIALVLLIAALPLISLGTTGGGDLALGLGLLALVIGGLLPVATRFVRPSKPPEQARDCGMEFDSRTS
jgi:hypothetical protein